MPGPSHKHTETMTIRIYTNEIGFMRNALLKEIERFRAEAYKGDMADPVYSYFSMRQATLYKIERIFEEIQYSNEPGEFTIEFVKSHDN